MAIAEKELSEILLNKFPGAEIKLTDLVGDEDHWQLEIKAKEFEGLNRVKQQRLVMAALKENLASNLHAISVKTGQL